MFMTCASLSNMIIQFCFLANSVTNSLYSDMFPAGAEGVNLIWVVLEFKSQQKI